MLRFCKKVDITHIFLNKYIRYQSIDASHIHFIALYFGTSKKFLKSFEFFVMSRHTDSLTHEYLCQTYNATNLMPSQGTNLY